MGHEDPSHVVIGSMVGPIPRGAVSKPFKRQHSTVPDSPATRPEDLGVTSWYLDEIGNDMASPGGCDGSSYPSSYNSRQERGLASRPDLYSTKDSSVESSDVPRASTSAPRKAYMDLTDAMALLDETCPNQEASPSLTPKTPRTPLTPFPRSRRTRSKSSDNSSNYSNDRLSERSLETSKSQDKEKRRPFLRKIGISKTEDRPFLAKIMTPRIIGKPYLEKIGPSRAVEKPFLEKIGTSRTLDKFTFDTLRELPRAMARRCQPAEPSPLSIERTRTEESHLEEQEETEKEEVMIIMEDEKVEEEETITSASFARMGSRRTNGKGYLLKMYSFEADDLSEATAAMKAHRDPLRGASLDDVLDSGPSSLPPSDDSHERASSRSENRSSSVAELLKCRVTTSDEIFSSSTGYIGSPSAREVTSSGNSPLWTKRRSRRVASTPRTRADREQLSSIEVFPSDDSTPNSPTKRRISRVSPETRDNDRIVVSRTKNSSLPRDLVASPSKTRRQASEDDGRLSRQASGESILDKTNARKTGGSRSRRQTFDEAVEKFGGTEYSTTRTRRQVSEEILDRNRENKKNGECDRFDDPHGRFERRGISSDNLKLSRETVVGSMPSASSLGYQSGDSSLTSQRSSNHSQDFIRGTFKMLHDKFELQDVPVESYAAFKRRTRVNYNNPSADKNKTLSEKTVIVRSAIENAYQENFSKQEKLIDSTTTGSPTTVCLTRESTTESKDYSSYSASEGTTESRSSVTVKSVLRKQEQVDHQSDQETESSHSLRCPKRRIIHEPSQETMDLLTELRKVKSLLRTPSAETDIDLDYSKPPRLPKKILLTDREFCLSVERENSIRRPSMLPPQHNVDSARSNCEKKEASSAASRVQCGPALFEKRCMSLDYADDEKPPKPEVRAISLAAATPHSEIEETGLTFDAKSYCSDVFTTPSDGTDETHVEKPPSSDDIPEVTARVSNHCAEVDIAIPVDQIGSISPRRRIHIQERTSDLYEIISPRSTPFRVKKRLGRISVEETVKQESFTLNKVDCKSVVTQKRTKCFPL